MRSANLRLTIYISVVFGLSGCFKTYHFPQNVILGTWQSDGPGSVIHDGVDISSDYPALALTFDRTSLTNPNYCTGLNSQPIFPTLATWAWMGSTFKQISINNGDFLLTVEDATKEVLLIKYVLSEQYLIKNGGDAALSGEYKLRLKLLSP